MTKTIALFLLVSLALTGVSCDQNEPQANEAANAPAPAEVQAEVPAQPLYAFQLNDIDGNPVGHLVSHRWLQLWRPCQELACQLSLVGAQRRQLE